MATRLTLDQFEAQSGRFDAAVAKTEGVDVFCSQTPWILPAHHALMEPGREAFIFSDGDNFVALMRGMHPEGWSYLQPLEATWCFASPLAGNPSPTLDLLCEALQHNPAWHLLLLCGIKPGSTLYRAALSTLSPRYRLGLGPSTLRYVADLQGGLDGFLARRSRNMRKSLRRTQGLAQAAGIVFESLTLDADVQVASAYQRILAIEAQSWKGRLGDGIIGGGMRQFYRMMLQRLAPKGAIRLLFARHNDADIGYILGGIEGSSYRGLQFSYHHDYQHFGVGNLLQLQQIEALCAEGITEYDLGSEVAYKQRWGEQRVETVTLVASR